MQLRVITLRTSEALQGVLNVEMLPMTNGHFPMGGRGGEERRSEKEKVKRGGGGSATVRQNMDGEGR